MPECHDMPHEWCLHMTRLKGLVVYLYRNTSNEALYKIVKQNQSLDLPYGLQSTGSLSDKSVFWPKFLNNSKMLPNIPALYIPNKFTFIYFYSFHIQSVIINRLSQTEGLIEKNWKEISRRGPYPHGREHLLTAFWWKPNNEVYIIAEENKTLRVYKLGDDMNQTFEFLLVVSLKTLENFNSNFDFLIIHYRIKRLKNFSDVVIDQQLERQLKQVIFWEQKLLHQLMRAQNLLQP